MRSKSTFVALFFIVAGVITALVLDRAFASLFAVVGVANTELLGARFTLSTAAALVVAGAGAFVAWSHPKSKTFTTQVVDELYKVNWPDWAETKVSTFVVVVTSLVAAAILGVFDITFGWLAQNNLFLY